MKTTADMIRDEFAYHTRNGCGESKRDVCERVCARRVDDCYGRVIYVFNDESGLLLSASGDTLAILPDAYDYLERQ